VVSCAEERNAIITEKKSPRKFYVDWSEAHNHQYFTKNGEEDLEDPAPFEHPPHAPLPRSPTPACSPKDYWDLNHKLEMALALIKNAHHSQEGKFAEKRSMSNEPRK
jgi:hypothetical protein